MNLLYALCLAVTLLCTYQNGCSQESAPQHRSKLSPYLRPSITFQNGLSIPFGKFRESSDWMNQTSSAREGFVTEISASLFPRKYSRWQTSVLFGYMYNPFRITDEQITNLHAFKSSDWQVGYGMVGLNYTSASRLYVGLDLYIGLLIYDGGNVKFNERTNHMRYVQKSYQYPIHSYIAFKGGLRLGYKVAQRVKVDIFGQLMYAPSHRTGQYIQAHYQLNRSNEELIYLKEQSIQDQTSIMTINIGLSLHYLLIRFDADEKLYAISNR